MVSFRLFQEIILFWIFSICTPLTSNISLLCILWKHCTKLSGDSTELIKGSRERIKLSSVPSLSWLSRSSLWRTWNRRPRRITLHELFTIFLLGLMYNCWPLVQTKLHRNYVLFLLFRSFEFEIYWYHDQEWKLRTKNNLTGAVATGTFEEPIDHSAWNHEIGWTHVTEKNSGS